MVILPYVASQKEEAKKVAELTNWQRQIIDKRLNDYYKEPCNNADFDKTIDDIEKNLLKY